MKKCFGKNKCWSHIRTQCSVREECAMTQSLFEELCASTVKNAELRDALSVLLTQFKIEHGITANWQLHADCLDCKIILKCKEILEGKDQHFTINRGDQEVMKHTAINKGDKIIIRESKEAGKSMTKPASQKMQQVRHKCAWCGKIRFCEWYQEDENEQGNIIWKWQCDQCHALCTGSEEAKEDFE